MDGGRWTAEGERWTAEGERCKVDGGRWTVDEPGTKPVIMEKAPKQTPNNERSIYLSMNRPPCEVFSTYL